MEYQIEGEVINTNEDICCKIQCDLCIASFLITLILLTIGYIIITLLNN